MSSHTTGIPNLAIIQNLRQLLVNSLNEYTAFGLFEIYSGGIEGSKRMSIVALGFVSQEALYSVRKSCMQIYSRYKNFRKVRLRTKVHSREDYNKTFDLISMIS